MTTSLLKKNTVCGNKLILKSLDILKSIFSGCLMPNHIISNNNNNIILIISKGSNKTLFL